MNSKEQILYFFLQGKISLSQYDYKFMSNLQMMISNDSRVTTNQATLFDNLISKYQKQLAKAGYDKQTLKALPWKTDVVESTTEHTSARLSLFDNELKIRVPFNKSFISKFRDITNNKFEWHKEHKCYKAPFTTTSLKIAVKTLPEYFPSVSYCSELTAIFDQMKKYEGATFWEPTLVNNNGHLLIAASNHIIDEVIKDIDLQLNMKTLYQLSQYGIKVDSKITDTDPGLKFASEFVTEVDLDDMDSAAKWLREIECGAAILGRGVMTSVYSSANRSSRTDLKDVIAANLSLHEIPVIAGDYPRSRPTIWQQDNLVVIQAASIVSITDKSQNPAYTKYIIVKNSRPIEVK